MSVRRNCGTLVAAMAVALNVSGCKQSSLREPVDTAASSYQRGPDKPQEFDFATGCTDVAACKKLLHGLPRGFGVVRNRSTATPGDSTPVLVLAYDGARHVNPKNPPKQPTLLVHIVNEGTVTASLWDLKPSTEAEYDVTVQDEGGSPKWTLWEITTAGAKATYKGDYIDCGHTTHWDISIADWASCATSPGGSAASSTPMTASGTARSAMFGGVATTFAKYLAMFQASDDPAWVSCSAGCCTIDNGASRKEQ